MWWFLFGYLFISAGLAALTVVGKRDKTIWDDVFTFLVIPLFIPVALFAKLFEWLGDE